MRSSDSEAIRASLSEPERFRLLFDRHFDDVFRFLSFRVRADLADELASETFTKAFEHRGSFDLGVPSARPWLFGIAANLARSASRRESRGRQALMRLLPFHGSTVTESELAADRAHAAVHAKSVRSAIAALNSGQRDVFLLVACLDLTYDEVALSLDIPIGTVRSRFSRARAQVRAALHDLDPTNEPQVDSDSGERR